MRRGPITFDELRRANRGEAKRAINYADGHDTRKNAFQIESDFLYVIQRSLHVSFRSPCSTMWKRVFVGSCEHVECRVDMTPFQRSLP